MKVRIHLPAGKAPLLAFAEGLKRHGVEVEVGYGRGNPDLGVFWGMRDHQHAAHYARHGIDFLVMELPYLGSRDGRSPVSLGFNGLNGHAEMYAMGCPSDRWEKHGTNIDVQPWKLTGDFVLLLGQVPSDANLAGCPDYSAWLNTTARAAESRYGLPVRFRPHPMGQGCINVPAPLAQGRTLQDDLSSAAVAIAWNSNALVDAVVAGVPVVAGDRGSMTWPVAARDVSHRLVRPDRRQWLCDLMYCQWTADELALGIAWDHLSQRYR